MNEPNPVIAIVGPGAVGGLVAWLLHRAGANVVVVGRQASVERINSNGIRVESAMYGSGVEFVPARETVPQGSSVILAVKTFGLEDSMDRIAGTKPHDVLSLMNGIGHADVLSRQLAGVPIAAGSIAVEAIRIPGGTIEHRSPFARIAVPSSAAQFSSVRLIAETGMKLTIGGTDAEVLWHKFRFLAPMALLTSYWRTGLGEALRQDPELTQAVLAEVVACENAAGVPDSVGSLIDTLSSFPKSMHSSLQNDLAAGNQSELDAIGGELIRQAASHSVAVPSIEKIVATLARAS